MELEERSTKYGHLLGCGANEVGQLGFDEDVTEKTRPALIIEDSKAKIVEISAGGMHSLYLTADGEVLSFGCNDEGNKFGIILFFLFLHLLDMCYIFCIDRCIGKGYKCRRI